MGEKFIQVREFIGRHAMWVGIFVVAIPLCTHLALQYRALRKLQNTLPAARKANMRRYVMELGEHLNKHYDEHVNATLNVPAAAFLFRYPDNAHNLSELSEDQLFTPVDLRKVYNFDLIRQHFNSHPFPGARKLFVGIAAGVAEPRYAFVNFYDQTTCSFRVRPSEQENGAAHAAAAQWIGYLMTNTRPKSRDFSVDERDPNNRIIVKPIFDERDRLVGVAGMLLNENYFSERLAREINDTLPDYFPEDHGEAIITSFDQQKNVLYANQRYSGAPFEVAWRLPMVFTDRYIGMRMRVTEEEIARQYFNRNLAISIITALVLLAGVALTMRSASRAMRLSQMKTDFVSNVSHELRTPLASIRVFGEFLKLGRVKDQARIREYGEYIETESRRLTQLINNILDFSKIESGQKNYQFTTANIADIVHETLKTFEVRLDQSGFAVQYEPPTQPMPAVSADADALAQALLNLLDNAFKYSGEGRVIQVRLAYADKFITIAVTDHGIGIPAHERDKVFEKFYRVGDCLVHDVKGSGLGLSIVKHIIEAHRGFVTVTSEQGKGSTFTIHLPAAEPTQPMANLSYQDCEQS